MSNFRFAVSDAMLRRICTIHHFPLEEFKEELVFFGIRGALPSNADNASFDYSAYLQFQDRHVLKAVQVNYFFPRCVLGQWIPSQGEIAVFPASTVPNLGYVSRRKLNRYQFNQLVPGMYDYGKGNHPYSSSGFQQHKAFRMLGKAVVRRNNFQLTNGQPGISYALDQSHIEVCSPGDNIHAARNNPKKTVLTDLRNTHYSYSFTMADFYSSYGCQVIVGNPEQYLPSGETNGSWNAWDQFYKYGYETQGASQQAFKYILFSSMEALDIAGENQSGHTPSELRFGSEGDLVRRVQERLSSLKSAASGKAYYTRTVDEVFGPKMAEAVIQFQKDNFHGQATGLVDARTASALGVSNWPDV
ncbi:MAG: peptidoglycan-binding domain-containing protein [Saprospiraceae bacterium]